MITSAVFTIFLPCPPQEILLFRGNHSMANSGTDSLELPSRTRRRMARERRGAGSSLVSMETQFYKQYMKDVL